MFVASLIDPSQILRPSLVRIALVYRELPLPMTRCPHAHSRAPHTPHLQVSSSSNFWVRVELLPRKPRVSTPSLYLGSLPRVSTPSLYLESHLPVSPLSPSQAVRLM